MCSFDKSFTRLAVNDVTRKEVIFLALSLFSADRVFSGPSGRELVHGGRTAGVATDVQQLV